PRKWRELKKGVQGRTNEAWKITAGVFADIGDSLTEGIFGVSRAKLDDRVNPLEGGTTADQVLQSRKVTRTSTTIAGGLTAFTSGKDKLVALGNASASNQVLQSAIKKIGGGAKMGDLSMAERAQLRSYVPGEDSSIELTAKNFYNMQQSGDIVVNSTVENSSELGSAYSSAKDAVISSVMSRLSDTIGKGDAIDAVSKLKTRGSDDWNALLAFAVQKGKDIDTIEDFQKALSGNSQLAGVFKRAGIDGLEKQYQVFLSASTAASNNKEAYALGMSTDLTGKSSNREVAAKYAKNLASLKAAGFKSLASMKGVALQDSSTIRRNQTEINESLSSAAQDESGSSTSMSVAFKGFEKAVGTQVSAADKMDKAATKMLAAAGVEDPTKLSTDENKESSATKFFTAANKFFKDHP
ncbi:MAG TPA: hypothetical protein VFM18_07100, partial [Methanosarcina sp.]|nr:hypothetical protein [Methanosarcina sp.]